MSAGFQLLSPAFKDGDILPVRYTGDGAGKSPPLYWENLPAGTKGLCLVCEDPDAPRGTFDHWVVYGIPPQHPGFDEGLQPVPVVEGGIRQGKNSWGRTGYAGPTPPPGPAHRYVFSLLALGRVFPMLPGLTKQELLDQISSARLGLARLAVLYARPPHHPIRTA